MKTKQIRMLVAASISIGVLPVYAGNFDSSYTSVKEKDCTTLETHEAGSVQSCPKFGDIKVKVIEGDLRQSITLNRNGTDYPLNFWETVSANWSELGPKIEWRYKTGKSGNPVGIIVRLNVSENPEKPQKKTSYLVVSKITTDNICVVGKVSPQAKQNQKARTMAEQSADMSCLNTKTSAEVADRIYFDIATMKWRDKHGVCHTCTKENGFPTPAIRDGFYYDSENKLWRDGHDGAACHTCTPRNGFPANPDKT